MAVTDHLAVIATGTFFTPTDVIGKVVNFQKIAYSACKRLCWEGRGGGDRGGHVSTLDEI